MMRDASHDRRRGERLLLAVPVAVAGIKGQDSFREETHTISMSKDGLAVRLRTPVDVGQRVLLIDAQTWDEREAWVTRVARSPEYATVAVEFHKATTGIWPSCRPPKPTAFDIG
jgi:hypothetical protein